jgi:signal transduction histidine kinase
MKYLEYLFSMNPVSVIIMLLSLLIMVLAIYLEKIKENSRLKKERDYLNRVVYDLDCQAKLIIKGDMELKLYQEEIEDKLNKLTLLKNLIISSLNILDKDQLFAQIDERTVNDLGFKKGAILKFADTELKVNFGFNAQEIEAIKVFLQHKKNIFFTVPLLSPEYEASRALAASLQAKDFLMAPIKTRENIYAVFALSNLLMPTDVKRAEKEIFSIICMYLGQCLDNIKLFEDIYHTKDELEKKVKERTNELVKSLRDIEVISKAKSDFISGVSHELRTPLTSIKGFSSLLVDEKFGKLPAEAKNKLMTIDENVNKLVEMVNTLLDIARIEAGKTEVKIAPADLSKVIRDTVEFMSPQIYAKKINLSLSIPDMIMAYMDKNLIERVFINLIGNALKFTPAGGELKINCIRQDSQLLIKVSDNGCGIEKENLEKIFQEFFRVDNTTNKETKGTGLGLSLAKRIIETHKEKIWVESEVGKGTAFYFTLKPAKNEQH